MLNKSNKASAPASRTMTIIGPGSTIEGSIVFAGFLRVQGRITGDVNCDADPGGTMIVHSAGSVVGTVHVPNVSVSGNIAGPVHASESIEINQGARITGDAWYKRIAIHAGGVLDGLLTPTGSIEETRSRAPLPAAAAPAIADAQARANTGSIGRLLGWRTLGAAGLLIVAVVAAVWANRGAPDAPPPPSTVASAPVVSAPPVASAPPVEAAPPVATAPAVVAAPAPVAKPVETPPAAPAVVPPPQPAAPASGDIRAPEAKAAAEPDAGKIVTAASDKIITVHGMSPEKPANVFFVVARQPTVLFKKRRDDTGEGTRIEVAKGAKMRIPIAGNELLRIAEGRELDLFFQGRKVSMATLRSGAWMNFDPEPTGADAAR